MPERQWSTAQRHEIRGELTSYTHSKPYFPTLHDPHTHMAIYPSPRPHRAVRILLLREEGRVTKLARAAAMCGLSCTIGFTCAC